MNADDIHAWKASAERAEQECRDRDAVEQDLRARLADAEKALARVRELADECFDLKNSVLADDLRAALDGKP